MTLAFLFAGAGTAHAATAHVADECEKALCHAHVVYEAAPGERNALTTEGAGPALILRDAGAEITAGDRCVPIAGGVSCVAYAERHVRCEPAGVPGRRRRRVPTADGDISGGRGDDRLTGDGTLRGGPGDDVAHRPRRLLRRRRQGAGTRRLSRHRRSRTVDNSLSYRGRADGVRVDLRPGRHSEDRISGIPSITGGDGDDVLIGDDGPNSTTAARGATGCSESAATISSRPGTRAWTLSVPRSARRSSMAGPATTTCASNAGPARLRCGAGEDSASP